MVKITLILNLVSLLILLDFSHGNDLVSLIDGLTPQEEIKINGTLLESSSGEIKQETDEEGKMSVSFTGKATLSVTRSTGISSGNAQELLQITQKALGTRNQLIASMKRGGRLLTMSDVEKLNEIVESSKQKIEIYINNQLVDLDKASVVESQIDFTVLEPDFSSRVRIILSASSTSVVTSSEQDQVRIVLTRGLNGKQVEKLKENVYGIVAQRASEITGFPKELLELTVAGREAIVNRLCKILRPIEHITVGDSEIDLDKSKRMTTSVGMVLQPENYPKVKITWRKDEKLRVESEDGQPINVIYSKGVDRLTISRIVNILHRAITLRLGMISWSNRLLGSIPPQLESDLEELKTKIQQRIILVNGKEVDLKKASVIETTGDSVLYRVGNGETLRVYFNGAVSAEGNPLTLEYTPGISETQVANLFANINQLFSTSVGFSTDYGESLLNFESNRQLLQTLMRGIKPKERIKVDEEVLEFSNATISKEDRDLTEYTVDSFDDVILSRFTDGDIQVDGIGRTIFISRSTGLTLEFLNKLVQAINNVMPKKRWFYNFGNKGGRNQNKYQQLQSVIDEIPDLIQKQTVSIDKIEVDFIKASILHVDDNSVTYSPDTDSLVKVIRFANGDIETSAEEGQEVLIKVSEGITSQDADNLISNIKRVVGDRFKIGSKRPGNYWCSTGSMRKLLGWLLNAVSPKLNILQDGESLTDKTSSSIRDFYKNDRRNVLTVVNYKGRGKNITSRNGGKFGMDISTGLTQDISEQLVQLLVPLLENNEDVIRMITGSISDIKVKKIKDLLKSMIQYKLVQIDSEVLSPSSTYLGPTNQWSSLLNKKDIRLKDYSDGSIEIESGKNHVVSIAVSPGLTAEQAGQMYKNIMMAFKERFAEITKVPVQFIDVLSNLKKYFMISYFFSAAPPKEYVLVDGKEIHLKKLIQLEKDENNFVLDEPNGHVGLKIIKTSDGSLEVLSSNGGDIGVIKTTGLEVEQIDRILKAVEARLGLKNQMFRISSDELLSPPEKYEYLDTLLASLISTETLKINGEQVNLSRPKRTSTNDDGCSLQWYGWGNDLVVKKCPSGQVSVDYRGSRSVSLTIHPGISQQQSNYILKSLMTTIRTKSSNIKHLANYPDTFLKLLADGRIKSLEKMLYLLFPREDIIVDGNRIQLEPLEMNPDQEFQLTEFETRPGLEIYRFHDGSTQVKSWTGGVIDVHINSGFTDELLKLILGKFKESTSRSLEPFFVVMTEIAKGNASTVLKTVEVISRYHNSQRPTSGINMTLIMDLIESELKNRINRLTVNQELIRNIAEKAVQNQYVFINDQLIDLEKAPVEFSTNDYTVYSPKNIKITRYNNGRIVVECLKEETIAVTVSAGIPPKILSSFTESVIRYLTKINSDDKFTSRLRTKLMFYLDSLLDTATKGIENRRNIILNGDVIQISDDILLKESTESSTYQKDGITITLNQQGRTEVELIKPGKLELDISSGVLTEPMIEFLYSNCLQLSNEVYQSIIHYETVVPIMTKLEKIIHKMIESLQQKILINGKDIDSSSMKVIESTNDFKIVRDKHTYGVQITKFKDGKLMIVNNNPDASVKVSVSSGLSQSNQEKLLANIEQMFSKFNPVELVADIMDVLPSKFFILSQNMDRVLSIMNLIQF